MSREGLIALLVSVNFVCAVLIVLLLWFMLSGGLSRMLKRMDQRDKFVFEPRRIVRRYLRSGQGFDLALSFIRQCHFDKYGDDVDDISEVGVDGSILSTSEAAACAMLEAFVVKKSWRRYVRRFPIYEAIGEELSFEKAMDKFGGCIKKYEQL